jgi:RNA polymerase sigma factor (sigma-70 family)
MAVANVNSVLGFLRELAETQDTRKVLDPELLARFKSQGDEAAFKALVRRHGPMVFRLCMRLLRSQQDAEDAFQATFLVLAKKAGTLRQPESIGSWLFGVASRLACNMRKSAVRRRSRETQAAQKPSGDPFTEISIREAQEMVDEELSRLSEKYQAPFVLCCLEGLTRDEAARQLGLPLSTVRSRLEHAREVLRARLALRGLTVSSVLLASLLCGQVAGASVYRGVELCTIKAASEVAAGVVVGSVVSTRVAALTEGVLRAMFITKLKVATSLLLIVGFMAVATGIVASDGRGTEGPSTKSEPLAHRTSTAHDQREGERKSRIENKPRRLAFAFVNVNEQEKTLSVRIRGTGVVIDGFRITERVQVVSKFMHKGEEQEQNLTGFRQLNSILHDQDNGMPIRLELAEDGITVARIESTWYGLEGVVKAIDPTKNTITLIVRAAKPPEGAKWTSEGTLSVSPDTPVWIDAKESKLANLKPGMPVVLKTTQAQTPRRGLEDVTGITGIIATSLHVDVVVQSVDAAKSSVSAFVAGTKVLVKAVGVDQGAKVQIDGKESKLADLKAGMHASLQLAADPERSLVIGIRANRGKGDGPHQTDKERSQATDQTFKAHALAADQPAALAAKGQETPKAAPPEIRSVPATGLGKIQPEIRSVPAAGLGKIQPSEDDVKKSLKANNEEVQKAAIEALKKFDQDPKARKSAIEVLKKLLNDEKGAVREAAIKALKALEDRMQKPGDEETATIAVVEGSVYVSSPRIISIGGGKVEVISKASPPSEAAHLATGSLAGTDTVGVVEGGVYVGSPRIISIDGGKIEVIGKGIPKAHAPMPAKPIEPKESKATPSDLETTVLKVWLGMPLTDSDRNRILSWYRSVQKDESRPLSPEQRKLIDEWIRGR